MEDDIIELIMGIYKEKLDGKKENTLDTRDTVILIICGIALWGLITFAHYSSEIKFRLCALAVFVLLILFIYFKFIKEEKPKSLAQDSTEEKLKSRKKKLITLKKILEENLEIYEKEQISRLIDIYQYSLDERLNEITKECEFFYSLFTSLVTMIELVIDKLSLIETSIYLIGMVAIMSIIVKFIKHSYISNDTKINEYSMMIKDLKELLLIF